MFTKYFSNLPIRRRRFYVLYISVAAVCLTLYFGTRNKPIYLVSPNFTSINNTCPAIAFSENTLQCSGDPLQQWCQNQKDLCNHYLIVYDKLFAITRSVIVQAKFASGKRIGGEEIKSVLNQPESDEYFHFEREFIKLPCNITIPSDTFPTGHVSNILSVITSYETCPNINLINETTIAVNRQDYVNFYHTVTDIYTSYILCRFLQRDPKTVRILFIDAHPRGNLDSLWTKLFHSFTRLGSLKDLSPFFYRELVWAQPQSKSEIDITKYRRIAPSFLFDFREHTLNQNNVNDYKNNPNINCQSLNIFFLVRHNYVAHPRNPSGKITRQLANEQEILDNIQKKFSNSTNIKFQSNHFEELDLQEQLNTIVQADIFIGMHGAGLTHVLFMKSNRSLIELTTSSYGNVHFELLASMNNVHYQRCIIDNNSESSVTARKILACLTEAISRMCPPLTI